MVNDVGVDINRAVNEPYYAYQLPYVAGLGPRKAQALIKKIASLVRLILCFVQRILMGTFRGVTLLIANNLSKAEY